MPEKNTTNVEKALDLLIDFLKKNKNVQDLQDRNFSALAQAEALNASIDSYKDFIEFSTSLPEDDMKNAIALLDAYKDVQDLNKNAIKSFQQLTDEQRKDKDFLRVCLRSGVDGRILSHANPFIMFTSFPEDESNMDDWYETAELDDQFIGDAVKLNEHSFFGLLDNADIKTKIYDGYNKFDLWDDEKAWINALQNPKFLRYHDDFSLDSFIEEMAGTAIEQAFNETIAKVKSHLNGFASSIIHDYFFSFENLENVEKQYNIKFDEQYFHAVAENQTEEPTLNGHDQCQDIYDSTQLGDFEAIIKFIYAH